MSESSAVMEKPRNATNGQFVPKAVPAQQTAGVAFKHPFVMERVQGYLDQIAKDVPLPTIKPGCPPVEEYQHREKDGSYSTKKRARVACDLDANGNPIEGTGPQLSDYAADELWEMIKPHLEYFMSFTVRGMAECLLLPDAKGVIDDRAKLIRIPKGRFVFVPGQQPLSS